MATEPTTTRGRATRDRIVRAASELTAARGATGTAVDDVCARAHVSKSQLYHYFEDRDDLIRTVVTTTCSDVICSQADLLAQFDSVDGIRRYLDAIVALQHQRDAEGGCPIGSLAGQLAEHDDGARLAIDEGLTQWETGLRIGLEAMADRGELLPEADPSQLATQTLATLQGGLLLTQVRRDPHQIRIAADAILTLIHACSTPATGPAWAETFTTDPSVTP
jgi:TetR/AcrR family transcriptional repressor of nem operon